MTLRVGSKGEQVKRLQMGLSALGYPSGPADGHYGELTSEAVCTFQGSMSLLEDGIAGKSTIAAYNRVLKTLEAVVPVAIDSLGLDPITDYTVVLEDETKIKNLFGRNPGANLDWETCPADKYRDYAGYKSLKLREDIATKYKALYADVHDMGGIITTAGGRRSLAAKASPSRSRTSMHYLGRAFDLALPTGMQNPRKDPYIITKDPEESRKWIVWCKTEDESVPLNTYEACYVKSAKNAKGKYYTQLHTREVSCRAFNFTELAKKHGFVRISARRSFFRGGSYGGAEWWHFQCEDELCRGRTRFGQELLRTYTLAEAENFVYWDEAKDRVFGKNWF